MLDLDGLSQLSYQDNLPYREDDHGSVDSRRTMESRGAGQHKGPRMESSVADGISQQATDGCLELETAFSNQGFEGNDATDSSSAWSPEVQWIVFCYMWCKILKDTGGQRTLGEKWSEKLIITAEGNGSPVCVSTHLSLCSPVPCIVPLATNTHSGKLLSCLMADFQSLNWNCNQHLPSVSKEHPVVAQGFTTGCMCSVWAWRYGVVPGSDLCLFFHKVFMA